MWNRAATGFDLSSDVGTDPQIQNQSSDSIASHTLALRLRLIEEVQNTTTCRKEALEGDVFSGAIKHGYFYSITGQVIRPPEERT